MADMSILEVAAYGVIAYGTFLYILLNIRSPGTSAYVVFLIPGVICSFALMGIGAAPTIADITDTNDTVSQIEVNGTLTATNTNTTTTTEITMPIGDHTAWIYFHLLLGVSMAVYIVARILSLLS